MEALVRAAGFTDVRVEELSSQLDIPGDDDVRSQHLLRAR
jgi:hypothetical protein